MMPQKTLLILGGSLYIFPLINKCHELGIRVVTCDYLPHNYAHRFADEYINASIVDKDAILQVAQGVKADGIVSFAADPGVVTASYVAEKLGLPFEGSYESVSTLQHKDKFRAFLHDNEFNAPQSFAFSSLDEARPLTDSLPYPVIVKPTDSAGSKGVSRVDGPEAFVAAFENAISFSIEKKVIVEEFIDKAGFSSDADAFSVDGKMTCVSFTDQMFDLAAENEYTPAAYAMPSTMSDTAKQTLKDDLQRVCDLLGLQTGIYNIETRVNHQGKPYIMEMSPRGGGNRLAEMLRAAADQDLITATVLAAVGLPFDAPSMPTYDGCWYQTVVHSDIDGVFCGLDIDPDFQAAHVRDVSLWVEKGAAVHNYSSADLSFGSVFMRFDSRDELDAVLPIFNKLIRVNMNTHNHA